MLLQSLSVDPDVLRERTGWKLEPQGACKGDRCVPLPGLNASSAGGPVDASVLSERLGMALVEDAEHGVWALGPESGGQALTSAEFPELELPDRNGRPFSLRSLRGTRFVMVAWASW